MTILKPISKETIFHLLHYCNATLVPFWRVISGLHKWALRKFSDLGFTLSLGFGDVLISTIPLWLKSWCKHYWGTHASTYHEVSFTGFACWERFDRARSRSFNTFVLHFLGVNEKGYRQLLFQYLPSLIARRELQFDPVTLKFLFFHSVSLLIFFLLGLFVFALFV